MYVLLNGSFGVGKTTVARHLRRFLPRARIFDPEWVGLALMRMPGYDRSDFQELAAWRRLSILGARATGVLSSTVIVPMAFSDRSILAEFREGLALSGRPVLHFCLTAPLDVVRSRLAARGESAEDPDYAWVHRRAEECCRAHGSDDFATHVPTEGSPPERIAAVIARRIQGGQMDELKARIAEVFAEVPRPPNGSLLHPDSRDETAILPFEAWESWQGIPQEVLCRNYDGMSFFSAEAFRFFLPAFLSVSLDLHRTSNEFVVDATVYELNPHSDYAKSRFVHFTGPECEVIAAFLEQMASSPDHADAETAEVALRAHWRGAAGPSS